MHSALLTERACRKIKEAWYDEKVALRRKFSPRLKRLRRLAVPKSLHERFDCRLCVGCLLPRGEQVAYAWIKATTEEVRGGPTAQGSPNLFKSWLNVPAEKRSRIEVGHARVASADNASPQSRRAFVYEECGQVPRPFAPRR